MDPAKDLAADLCRRFEGLRLYPYLCPAGVPTIGYGSTRYPDGTPVTLNDPIISKQQAEVMLYLDLGRFLGGVVRACPGILTETPGRRAAILDFAYNLGVGRLQSSTLRRAVNARDWEWAAGELRKWVRGGGRVLPGLVLRREAEVQLTR